MEDFQELDHLIIPHNSFNDIKEYCLKNYPYESGGLVLNTNEIVFIESLRKDMLNYYPSLDFYKYIIKSSLVKFVFHSHLYSPEPSENDIFFIKNYDIPAIIYSLNKNVFLSVNIKHEEINTAWYIEEAGLWRIKH
jgi:proteasome lid subunit RPN8/RPN11